MFLRKLLGTNEKRKDAESAPPAGVQAMGATLQRKFAKGVQYNMKIIIKGDRNVGKTCLYQRLQGQKFKEEYLPTDEIQVASIQWNYKATDDVVKVEVWDVVDKGKKKKKLEGLKLHAEDDGYEDACLDAEFIDVYKGTHGVIMIMDITKQWTFDYIEREMSKVPAGLPVLLLANHRDMGHHRTVSEDKVRYYMEELDRGPDAGPVRYAEASMRNGFGLKYIHKFFNLPFLRLQRETLLNQLETNTREIQLTNEELDVHEESEEQNYDLFLDALTDKRREQAENLAESALKEAKIRQEDERVTSALTEAKRNAASKSVPSTPAVTPSAPLAAKGPLGLMEAPPAKPIPGMQLPITASSASTSPAPPSSVSAPVTPATTPATEQAKGGFMSRLFGGKSAVKEKKEEEATEEQVFPPTNMVKSIEDFSPEEGLDASFLEEIKDTKTSQAQQQDSSSDDETGNPMVAAYQDDLDSEDDVAGQAPVTVAIDDFSSDEEEEQAAKDSTPEVRVTQDEDYEFEKIDLPKSYSKKENKWKRSATNSPKPPSKTSSTPAPKPSPSPKPVARRVSDDDDNDDDDDDDDDDDNDNDDHFASASCIKPALHNGHKLAKGNAHSAFFTDRAKSKPVAAVAVESEESEEEADEDGGVHVLQDIEDISEDERDGGIVAVTQEKEPYKSEKTTEDKAKSEEEEDASPPVSSLQFEDLSVLEKGFSFSTGLPRAADSGASDVMSSSRHDTDTDNDLTSSSKKKKKKSSHSKDSKEKSKTDGEDKSRKKKKKTKDREKESPETTEEKEKEKKKKKKSKKREEEKKKEMDELEMFLGGGDATAVGGDGYESL